MAQCEGSEVTVTSRSVLAAATPGLTHLYWDAIDAKGHRHGPSSAEFDAHILTALDGAA